LKAVPRWRGEDILSNADTVGGKREDAELKRQFKERFERVPS
jgi:hypothetical protein